jgi:tetratricopeptide (TPR) repeat protein
VCLGEPRRAIEHNEQSLMIVREIGDRRGEGKALGNLGNAYAALDESRRAIELSDQQLVIAQEIGDRRGSRSTDEEARPAAGRWRPVEAPAARPRPRLP